MTLQPDQSGTDDSTGYRTPLVSVVMPTFNCGAAIKLGISGLVSLDYKNLEFLVVDDGSTDDTVSHVRRIADFDDRFCVIEVKENGGPAKARNEGLRRATGTYVWFVDWDDEWDPKILKRLVEAAEIASADIATCRAAWRGSDGTPGPLTDGSPERTEVTGYEAFKWLLSGRIKGYLWNKLFRRSSLPDNLFPDIRTQEDFCALVPLVAQARLVACIPDVLYWHVVRDGSLTNSINPSLKNLELARNVVRSTAGKFPASDELSQLLRFYDYYSWHFSTAVTALRLSEPDVASSAVVRARHEMSLISIVGMARISRRAAIAMAAFKVLGTRYFTVRGKAQSARRYLSNLKWVPRATQKQGASVNVAEGCQPVKILVRTLPLWRGNYGGVLQAFALQQALTELGADCDTDLSERLPLRRSLSAPILRVVSKVVRRPLGYRAQAKVANREIDGFVDAKLSTSRVYVLNRWARQSVLRRYDLFVCGSDQVWRPEYGDVPSYLFDCLDVADARPRVSYAASFGVQVPVVDQSSTGLLARRFAAVSVRERAAVSFCKSAWGIEAVQTVDPTLLLSRSVYDNLIDTQLHGECDGSDPRGLLGYVLDKSPEKTEAVDFASRMLGMEKRQIVGYDKHALTSPDSVSRPSVAEWLDAFKRAEFVITDSYHGCIFSIIFNRPFVAIGNADRGLERFTSLLNTVGLGDRLIVPAVDASVTGDGLVRVLQSQIDWAAVEKVLARERIVGSRFLQEAIALAANSGKS